MIKRRMKRSTLNEAMIEDIWTYWNKISDRTSCVMDARQQVADIVGCSVATVYRVVDACMEAQAGNVVTYSDRHPNRMLVTYVNNKFAKQAASETVKAESTTSDIRLLAESIKELAAAIEHRNHYMDLFSEVFKRS